MTVEELQAQCEKVPFFRFLGFLIAEASDTHILASMEQSDRHIGNPVTFTKIDELHTLCIP